MVTHNMPADFSGIVKMQNYTTDCQNSRAWVVLGGYITSTKQLYPSINILINEVKM